MLATFFTGSGRTWVATSDPDNSVQNSFSVPAEIYSFFVNTSTGVVFRCMAVDGSGLQTWTRINPQLQADWNQSDSNALDFIKNKPSLTTRSQASASRSLNTVFQINATRDSLVNYSVDIACTLSLTTGQAGTVFLEIASNSGFTNNVQEVSRFVNGNTGTLAIGLSLTQNVTGTLSGYVPIAYYARLRTANTTGTPTFTYRSGQEILL